MKYHPPYGSSDPDASYVDRNSSTSTSGSKVPAEAVEDTQREIVNVITRSGLTPDDDLQLAAAIQSGRLNYAVAAGTPNALAIVLDPAPAALTPGMIFRVLASATNTSTVVTLTVNGLGPIHVIGGNGQPPRIGDILGGRITTFVYDGAQAQIVGSAQIGLRNILIFDTPGTTSWTVPANVTRVRAVCVGGGGSAGYHQNYPGGGGGSGGRSTRWCDVTPGQIIPVTVGAGGSPAAPYTAGNTGGTSSFGAFCSSTGGNGGAGGTVAGGGPGNNTAGGSPGSGIGGDVNEFGAWGGDGLGNVQQGGAGGGPGNGRGASGFSSGLNASSYGGGGGGGGSSTTTSGGAGGGAGYKGCVIIEY